jgi:alpha-L-fucosidase
MLQEYIPQGQRIEEFYLEAWDGKEWKPIARSTTIGYKRILRFEDVTAQRVRVRITQSRVCPTLSSFSLYYSPEITREKTKIFR